MSFFKRYSFVTIYIACFTAGFFSYAIITRYTKTPPLAFIETRQPGDFKFINPLIECDSANFNLDTNFSDLKKNVTDYIDSQKKADTITHTSVYYRDMNNGPWFGIDENEAFSPASLVKVPLLVTYYKLAEKDHTILQKTLSVGSTFNHNDQNVPPEVTLIPTKTYTVDELINQMIIYSDNQAYDILIKNIDPTILSSTYNDLGVTIENDSNNLAGNILSVKSYASFFRILYNSSYLSKEMSEKTLKLLSQIKYTDGLVASVPPVVTIAHKFGERSYIETSEKQMHDCGIVYLPKKPYLVCIMTRGKDFQKLNSTIKNISNIIYKHLTTN